MRNARTLLSLLLFVMFALTLALMFFLGETQKQTKKADSRSGVGGQDQTALQDAAPVNPAASQLDALRPTFDVVRVEKDGSVVMAGQAEPGATVIVRSGRTEIGRATADANGEWILRQDRKLDPREHGLELSAQSPNGKRTVFSRQRLALSLSDPKRGEPLVALTEEGKPTRVLQLPTQEMLDNLSEASAEDDVEITSVQDLPEPAVVSAKPDIVTDAFSESPDPAVAEPVVGFASVDYEDAEQKSILFMSGIGTPGARVAIYIDNIFAGFVVADASGNWNFSDNRQLAGGAHVLRADVLDKLTNSVVARAEVNFDREPEPDSRVASFDLGSKVDDGGASDDVTPSSSSAAVIAEGGEEAKVIIVKDGDTLWHIAEQYYGDGARYTQIFRNNRNQIRNPHRIYPDQRFVVPDDRP